MVEALDTEEVVWKFIFVDFSGQRKLNAHLEQDF